MRVDQFCGALGQHLGGERPAHADGIVGGAGGGTSYGEGAVGRQRHRAHPELVTVVPSTTSARAPTGAEQPASSSARTVRSQVTAARVRGSSSAVRSSPASVVAGAALDRERALAGGREHLQRVEGLGDLVGAAEPGEAGAGQHHGVEVAGADLGDAGVHVAAHPDQVEAEAERLELGDAARGAGADGAAGGELAERQAVAGDERVARVLAEWGRRPARCPRRARSAGP